MWSYSFTGERSRFPGGSRVGYHVHLPLDLGIGESVAAEGLRLALEADFSLLLVDEAASCCLSLSEEVKKSTLLVVRLESSCHEYDSRVIENRVTEVTRCMLPANSCTLDGILLPWPSSAESTSADARTFVRTWKALSEIKWIKWIGADGLDLFQLELVLDAFLMIDGPSSNTLKSPIAVNLLKVSAKNQERRLQRWCQSRGIEVMALLTLEDTQELEAIMQQDPNLNTDIELFRISWALQSGLCPAFPNYDAWLQRGSKIHSADEYESWMADFKCRLVKATKHLRSPAEHKRIQLQSHALDAINCIDQGNHFHATEAREVPTARCKLENEGE